MGDDSSGVKPERRTKQDRTDHAADVSAGHRTQAQRVDVEAPPWAAAEPESFRLLRPAILLQSRASVRIAGGKESAEKLAVPAHDTHGNLGSQQRRQGL